MTLTASQLTTNTAYLTYKHVRSLMWLQAPRLLPASIEHCGSVLRHASLWFELAGLEARYFSDAQYGSEGTAEDGGRPMNARSIPWPPLGKTPRAFSTRCVTHLQPTGQGTHASERMEPLGVRLSLTVTQ